MPLFSVDILITLLTKKTSIIATSAAVEPVTVVIKLVKSVVLSVLLLMLIPFATYVVSRKKSPIYIVITFINE